MDSLMLIRDMFFEIDERLRQTERHMSYGDDSGYHAGQNAAYKDIHELLCHYQEQLNKSRV